MQHAVPNSVSILSPVGSNTTDDVHSTSATSDIPCLLNLASLNRPWTDIHARDAYLITEQRELGELAAAADRLLDHEPFCHVANGPSGSVASKLANVPDKIIADIARLAKRFAGLMRCDDVRVRLEQIVTNSCRKIHADNTDLRLITTYAGLGTQVPADNDPASPVLWNFPAGCVGLFKGRRFGVGHPYCFHRSPPAGDLKLKRIVLVIDTPVFGSDACRS